MARGRGGRREHRPHRPHELGPRIFWRGRWAGADLRPWGGGRITLRNPSARGWPERGNRTDDEETARRWAWHYVDLFRDERKREDLGLRPRDRPLGPLAEAWHQYRERRQKARKTIEGGISATGHLREHFGDQFPIEDVDLPRLQRFFDTFLEAGYEPRTLDTVRRQLSSFFAWAQIDPNPARKQRSNEPVGTGIELPRFDYTNAQAWSAEQLARIRTHADRMGLRVAVELALGTGARQNELWALEGRDFSRDRCTVHIRRQLSRDGRRKKQLKGYRSRTAVVLPFMWDHLAEGEEGLLLHDGSGGPVTPRTSRDLIVEVFEAADLYRKGLGWHSMRHTYAWLFLDGGGTIGELQRSLGHASVKTTEQIYGHWSAEDAASRAVARMYARKRPHLRVIS